MGNAVRKNRAKGKSDLPTKPLNPLEERLTAVIKEKANAANGKPVKFNRLLLKFPTLYTGFAKCKAVFEELDINQDGGLQLQELRLGCAKLGYMLSDEEVDRFFAATDINCNESLDVREFIVVLAIMHALEGVGNRDSVDPDIERTFKTAEQAFLCFDSSKDGYIDKEELLKLLQEGSTADKARSGEPSTMQSVIAQRFDELDTDGDGRISLVEFLFCLSNWVIDAEDDDGILAA